MRIREDVYDSAPNREFSGLGHKINPLKIVFKQGFVEKIQRQGIPNVELESFLFELFSGNYFFQKSVGKSNHDQRFFAAL